MGFLLFYFTKNFSKLQQRRVKGPFFLTHVSGFFVVHIFFAQGDTFFDIIFRLGGKECDSK
ncbi:hypothetical protein CHH65_05210 [Shouchella clausii]|nr:hypothetical protein WZ76_20380 [Shouchella clausii]PAF10348.1 hypothetical protein CHH65_05210 [Shouchella clausii]